jgi:hypothetical protein
MVFFLWLYSPIQALAVSMKLSVSLLLLDLGQSVGLLGRVISSSQGLYLTQTQKNAHTTQTLNIHAVNRIRTHGLGVRASEDRSCPRPLGYRDRHSHVLVMQNFSLNFTAFHACVEPMCDFFHSQSRKPTSAQNL